MVRDGIYYGIALGALACLAAYLLGSLAALPFALLAGFCLYFFRDPDRLVPDGPVAVSPADGKVVGIKDYQDGVRRISIFLNVFDVHVNRSPISGRIADVKYQRGKFLVASRELASAENEQNTVTVDGDGTQVVFAQIAGLIARRIVFNKTTGDTVGKGERVGMIKFGSRVDVYLGPEWELLARTGERVSAGSSALAKRRLGWPG